MNLFDKKNRLREEVKISIQKISTEERNRQSDNICRILADKIPKNSTICAYTALSDEVNLESLFKNLIQNNCKIYLPFYEKEMEFREYKKNTKMEIGAFGIAQPTAKSKIIDSKDVTIVLVPGRAFDINGNRMGRGKGIYDTWIEKQRKINNKTQFWGVAFKCQIIDKVPTQEHDQIMDIIITSDGEVSLTAKTAVLI